jgi:hypothetical protein
MNDKKYLDKVIEHLIRRTKIDYDKGEIIFPFTTNSTPFSITYFRSPFVFNPYFSLPFIKYCNRQFGLTEDEIEYVYHRYVKIIEDKI